MDEALRKKLGINENKPNDWFETLYANSNEGGEGVPWANMAPHPLFENWLAQHPVNVKDKTALVVGCGMGDDAIELESRGFAVTAFDVSESAIDICKKRFPKSTVQFVQADLIAGNKDWWNKFDFVLEIFTIQALPPKYEQTLIQNISDFVADQGQLLVITEIQTNKRTYENGPPWLLNPNYIASFENCGLQLVSSNSYKETEVGEAIHLSIFQKT